MILWESPRKLALLLGKLKKTPIYLVIPKKNHIASGYLKENTHFYGNPKENLHCFWESQRKITLLLGIPKKIHFSLSIPKKTPYFFRNPKGNTTSPFFFCLDTPPGSHVQGGTPNPPSLQPFNLTQHHYAHHRAVQH